MDFADLPLTWIAIRASGIAAWGLLTAVVVYGLMLRTRVLGQAAAPPALLNMHRWLGVLAIAFLAVHMGFLLIDPAVKFTVPQLFIPFLAPWKPLEVAAGIGAFWALIPVMVVARIRPRLGKQGATWFKRTHLLAYFAWPLATLHYILAGTDAVEWWSVTIILVGVAAVVFMLLTRGYVPKPARKSTRRK